MKRQVSHSLPFSLFPLVLWHSPRRPRPRALRRPPLLLPLPRRHSEPPRPLTAVRFPDSSNPWDGLSLPQATQPFATDIHTLCSHLPGSIFIGNFCIADSPEEKNLNLIVASFYIVRVGRRFSRTGPTLRLDSATSLFSFPFFPISKFFLQISYGWAA